MAPAGNKAHRAAAFFQSCSAAAFCLLFTSFDLPIIGSCLSVSDFRLNIAYGGPTAEKTSCQSPLGDVEMRCGVTGWGKAPFVFPRDYNYPKTLESLLFFRSNSNAVLLRSRPTHRLERPCDLWKAGWRRRPQVSHVLEAPNETLFRSVIKLDQHPLTGTSMPYKLSELPSTQLLRCVRLHDMFIRVGSYPIPQQACDHQALDEVQQHPPACALHPTR